MKSSFSILLALSAICLMGLCSCTSSSKGAYEFQPQSMHWLQFRGPGASGIAPENADPPIQFDENTNLLWKTELMSGWSSPCIVNDRIFLTGFDDSDSLLYTMAINRENGEVLWKNSLKPHGFMDMHPINTYANSTAASNGELIIAAFPNYGLVAYNLKGLKIWEYPHELITHFYYTGASSPVIIDHLVVLLINSPSDPRVVALDTRTGHTEWTIRAKGEDWAGLRSSATPVVYNDLIVLHLSGVLLAYNLDSREPEWWLNTQTTGVATPVIADDLLYINCWAQMGEESGRGEYPAFPDLLEKCDTNANGLIEQVEFTDDMNVYVRNEMPGVPFSAMHFKDDRFFRFFDPNKDMAIDESEWDNFLKIIIPYLEEHGMQVLTLTGSGEKSFLDVKWKVNKDTPETPSPLIVDKHILFVKDGGTVTVIDRESGELVHKDRIGASGGYFSSPILADNRIYLCSYNGIVSVLSGKDYRVLAKNRLREKIGASPLAVDDVLYLRTDKHLYAFREE